MLIFSFPLFLYDMNRKVPWITLFVINVCFHIFFYCVLLLKVKVSLIFFLIKVIFTYRIMFSFCWRKTCQYTLQDNRQSRHHWEQRIRKRDPWYPQQGQGLPPSWRQGRIQSGRTLRFQYQPAQLGGHKARWFLKQTTYENLFSYIAHTIKNDD